VADVIGGFPEHPAFRGPGAGEDVAFRQAVARHFRLAKTAHPFLRYRVSRGSHFDRFLDRSEVVDGKLVFTRPLPGGQPADLTAAWAAYDAAVRDRVTSVLTPASGEPLIAHACRAAAEFDIWAGRFPPAADGPTPHEGYALFLWARDGPGRGPVVALAEPSETAVGWLAAGAKAAGRERVVAGDPAEGANGPALPVLNAAGVRDWVEWRPGPAGPSPTDVRGPVRLVLVGPGGHPGGMRAAFDAWVGRVGPAGVVAVRGVGEETEATGFYQDLLDDRVSGGRAWREVGRAGRLRVVQRGGSARVPSGLGPASHDARPDRAAGPPAAGADAGDA
jgi:hypothetical protein